MILTRELLNELASKRGGWNWCQLKLLGVSWPPIRGWPDKVLGKDISARTVALILTLKHCSTKPEREREVGRYGLTLAKLAQGKDRGIIQL